MAATVWTLGKALVAIEEALITKGRHITDATLSLDARGRGRIGITFDPPYHSEEIAFGATWRGYTRLIGGEHPDQVLRQIERMDVVN